MISWYDLAAAARDRYLDWLHGAYIPKLLRVPGVLCAAHYEVDQSEKPLSHLRQTRENPSRRETATSSSSARVTRTCSQA